MMKLVTTKEITFTFNEASRRNLEPYEDMHLNMIEKYPIKQVEFKGDVEEGEGEYHEGGKKPNEGAEPVNDDASSALSAGASAMSAGGGGEDHTYSYTGAFSNFVPHG